MEKRKVEVLSIEVFLYLVLIFRLHGVNKKLMVPTNFLTSVPVTSTDSGNEVGNNRNSCR